MWNKFGPNKRHMSFINNANSKGPSTEPRGTPLFVDENEDLVKLWFKIDWDLPER